MKAVLVLCLLAFISSQKDIIDIGKCIYKAPKVKELIADVMVAIATKDFSKLLPKIKEALPELIKIVIGCITEEKKVAEEETTLKGWFDTPEEIYCQKTCSLAAPDTNSFTYKYCYQACLENMKEKK